MRLCQHFEYFIIRICVIAWISPSFGCTANISPSYIISLAIIVNRLASIWLTVFALNMIWHFEFSKSSILMSWPNDTYLNRCENSKTIICNLSRISPPPHDQSPAYYSGHTAFTLWYIHFSTVRLYANAFSRERKKLCIVFFANTLYYDCSVCMVCTWSVRLQFTHLPCSSRCTYLLHQMAPNGI